MERADGDLATAVVVLVELVRGDRVGDEQRTATGVVSHVRVDSRAAPVLRAASHETVATVAATVIDGRAASDHVAGAAGHAASFACVVRADRVGDSAPKSVKGRARDRARSLKRPNAAPHHVIGKLGGIVVRAVGTCARSWNIEVGARLMDLLAWLVVRRGRVTHHGAKVDRQQRVRLGFVNVTRTGRRRGVAGKTDQATRLG